MPQAKRDYLGFLQSFLPGPGQYEPKLLDTSLGFKIKGKSPERNRNDIPGPGTYEAVSPNATKQGLPVYDFGKSPRKPLNSLGIDVGPG